MLLKYVTQTLRTKDRQFDNFVVTGGTVSCHYDNLRCHQSRQSCQTADLLFSVLTIFDTILQFGHA